MSDMLLIKPPNDNGIIPPIGLGYLSTALKKHNISTKIIHCYKDNMDIPDIIDLIKEKNINIVGVSTCSNDHSWLVKFADKLEILPEVNLIVGGPHATGLGQDLLLMISRINFIIVAEGETGLPKLITCLMNNDTSDNVLSTVPNLVWKNSSEEMIANAMERPNDLDALGFPDWEQMPPSEYARFFPFGGFSKASPVAQIITTRGCPYTCNYCAGNLMLGRKLRMRSTESIIEEIEYLVNVHGVREVHIHDDNFSFYKDHVVNLCTGIRKKNFDLFFSLPNGLRIDRIDDEMLQELQATGFYTFSLGLESGSKDTLKRMHKVLDLDRVREKIAMIRKYNFQLKGFFMIGYPGDTKDDILTTIQYAISLDLDRAYFTMYMPLPGTDDFRMLLDQGKIDIHKLEWDNFFTKAKPSYVSDGMTSEDLQYLTQFAYRKFYLRPRILLKIWRDLKIKSFEHFTEVMRNLVKMNLSYFI